MSGDIFLFLGNFKKTSLIESIHIWIYWLEFSRKNSGKSSFKCKTRQHQIEMHCRQVLIENLTSKQIALRYFGIVCVLQLKISKKDTKLNDLSSSNKTHRENNSKIFLQSTNDNFKLKCLFVRLDIRCS